MGLGKWPPVVAGDRASPEGRSMTTNARESLQTGPHGDASFTTHTEPPEQDGARYSRYTGCRLKILCSIGKVNLTYTPRCDA